VAFFPDQVIEQKSVAPVVLTDFRLFGEPVQTGKGPLKQPIWSATSLELEARSIFSFDFSALNYVDPARIRYRYRLEGLESKWNETDSTRRTVTYTTLPAGNYSCVSRLAQPVATGMTAAWRCRFRFFPHGMPRGMSAVWARLAY
jgi:hypothetical protein